MDIYTCVKPILKSGYPHVFESQCEVHQDLQVERQQGYTTVLKSMQIMFEKGLLTRDDSKRTHVYYPAVEEAATRSGLLQDLVNKAFGGSALELLMHASFG